MRTVCLAIVVVCVSTACAYHAPTAPSPPPLDLTTPSTLLVSAAPGLGSAGGTAAITALVSNVAGAPLPSVTVTFSADVGEVTPAAVSNEQGLATATLTGPAGAATITAHAGALTRVALVALQPVPPSAPPPTADPPPTSPPPASPGPLTVQLLVTAAPAGSPTLFGLAVSAGMTSATWDFGDGSPAVTTPSPTTSYAYPAGTFTASVIVRDRVGRTASAHTPVVIVNPPPPPPPPPPSVTVTLRSSAPTVVVLVGTLTFTAAVTNLNAGEGVTAYQWDLDGAAGYEATTTANMRTSAPYPTHGMYTAKVQATTSTGRSVTGTVGFFVTN
jgi:hypothetical protein